MVLHGRPALSAETSTAAPVTSSSAAGGPASPPPKDAVPQADGAVSKDISGTKSEPVVIHGIVAKEVTGTVRLIRSTPETEVFFKDLKDSLIIPKDSQHNKLYDLCEESRKKGTPVKLLIDPVGRSILSPPKSTENSASPGSD